MNTRILDSDFRNKIQHILLRYGLFRLFLTALYPISTLLTTPWRLLQSLYNSRVLLDGNWGDYPHFNPNAALVSFFYHCRAISFYRFGRKGKTPFLGYDGFALGSLFQYTLPSIYFYWFAGCVCLLCGMSIWWLSHLLWLDVSGPWLVFLAMTLALISTTFYANLFCNQNYNVLGWALFPAALYGIVTGNFLVTTLFLFAVSLGSFTVTVLGILLVLVQAATHLDFMFALTIIPAGLKLLSHFLPAVYSGLLASSLSKRAKAIGLSGNEVRYKRSKRRPANLVWFLYEGLLLSQFVVVYLILQSGFPVLSVTVLCVLIINSCLMRFADLQTIQMLIMSVTVAEIIASGNPWLLIPLWFVISPIPLLTVFPLHKNVLDVVPRKKPVNIRNLYSDLQKLLEPVKQGQRVLMAYDDPANDYVKVFDGYRSLHDILQYIAIEKDVHIMPDWVFVFENNSIGADDCWGRSVEACIHNMEKWHADFLIIYTVDEAVPVAQWVDAGFKVVGSFDWKSLEDERCNMKMSTEGPPPKWWLLKPENSIHSDNAC